MMYLLCRCGLLFLIMVCLSCRTLEHNDCIDMEKINPDAICTAQFDPVCGCDSRTYANSCEAENAGVISYSKGACKEDIKPE